MRIRTIVAVFTGLITLIVVNVGTTPSIADTGTAWTVSPGGAAVARSGVMKLTDTKTGQTGICTSSQVDGIVKTGSGLSGNDIGSVTSTAFHFCTGPGKTPFAVTGSGLPWQLTFTNYIPRTGVVLGTVSHIRVIVTGRFCSAVVNGVVRAEYTNHSGALQFLAASTLHFWDVKGCAPLLNNGDPATLTASYAVTPRQEITGY